jgi:hypothetical protein
MEVSGQLNTPTASSPGKNTSNVSRMMGGPQNRSGQFMEEKTFCSCRDSNPWLSYPYPSHYTDDTLAPSGQVHIVKNKYHIYCISCLFNDAVSRSDYMAVNGTTIELERSVKIAVVS